MLNARIAVYAALIPIVLPQLAQASDLECTQAGLKQFVVAQGQAINNYMSQVDNPRQVRADIGRTMAQKEADGVVENHDDEMDQLINDPNFEPSSKLCDDLQVSMKAYEDYMHQNPVD